LVSLKKCFNKDAEVKIDSVASTGSEGEYMNVSFPWFPVVATQNPRGLHEYRIAAEVIGS